MLNAYFFFQGATIKAEEETGRILIARVMHGGAADRSGLISVGDEVIEVNGVNVEGQTPNDVLKILVSFLDILESPSLIITFCCCSAYPKIGYHTAMAKKIRTPIT